MRRRRGWKTSPGVFPEEEATGAIGLGGGCVLVDADPVEIWTFRGGVDVPRKREGVRRSTGGPSVWPSSASLTLGIADNENVVLWRLS